MIPLITALLAVVTSLIISIFLVSETEKIKENQERPATKEEFASEDLFNAPYEKKISYDSDDENAEIPDIQVRISETRQAKDYSLLAAQHKIQRTKAMQINFAPSFGLTPSVVAPLMAEHYNSTDDFWNTLTASSPQLAEVSPELLDECDVPLPHTEHTEYKVEVRTRNRSYKPDWKDRSDLFLESYNKYMEKKKRREERRIRRRNKATSNSSSDIEPSAGSQDNLISNNNNDNNITPSVAQPAVLEDEGEDFGSLGVIKCLTADPDAEDICIANTAPPKSKNTEDSDSEQDDDRDIDMVMRRFGKSAKNQGMDLRNYLKEIKEEDKQKKKLREDMMEEHRQAVEFRNREIFEYSLWKRFSEFDELHNELMEQFWTNGIPVPDLPRRSITAERTDPAFIELRRCQLENYLSALVADDTIKRSRYVQAFLKIREGFDVEERRPKDTTYEGAKKFLKEQIEAIPVVDDPDIEAD